MDKKILKLNGGLGNQMFQYAFGLALGKQTQAEIFFDFSYFEGKFQEEAVVLRDFDLKHFNLECKKATQEDLDKVVQKDERKNSEKILYKFFRIKKFAPAKNVVLQSNGYAFEKKLLDAKKYYYDGYFQNEKYFKHIKKELEEKFSLKEDMDEKNKELLKAIEETNSVSIHIRRGDYVTLESANKFHGTCSVEYYEKAIELIAKRVKNPHFFVFSDDFDWVSKNIKIAFPFTMVDFNGDKGWLDMALMKKCKHNIIANSSFSWWGAWLNENSKKIVIAPKKWITQNKKCDIFPKEWVKI